MGWSGSPSTWTTWATAFFALSPSVWMMTPQLTEQYGHVLRVSLVREILRVLACARTGATSKPKAERAAPPTIELWRNTRREIAIGHLRCENQKMPATSAQVGSRLRSVPYGDVNVNPSPRE